MNRLLKFITVLALVAPLYGMELQQSETVSLYAQDRETYSRLLGELYTLCLKCREEKRWHGCLWIANAAISSLDANSIKSVLKEIEWWIPFELTHLAAYFNDCELLIYLKKEGDSISAKDENGKTVLHWAASHNAVDAMKLLKEWGVDVNAKDKNGKTALHWAATHNAVDAMKLLKKWDVDAKDLAENFSVFCGSYGPDAIALLVEWGVANVNLKGRNGRTPLLCVSSIYKKETVDMLCFLGAKVTDELTELRKLTFDDRDAAIKCLTLINDIQKNLKENNAFKLLYKAVEQGLYCSVKKILDRKIVKDVNTKIDNNGFTLLHYAASKGPLNLVKVLLTCPEIDPYCKTYGTKQSCKTCKSMTPKDKLRKIPLVANQGCKECGALTPYDVATKEVKALYDEMRYRIKIIMALKCKGSSKALLPKELDYIIFNHANTAKYCWLPRCLKKKKVVENTQDESHCDKTDHRRKWCSIL